MREDETSTKGRKEELRPPYERPALTVLGTIAELTMGNTTAVPDTTVIGSQGV